MSLGAIFVLMSLLYGSAYAFPALVPLVAAEFGASRVVVGGAFGGYLIVIAAAGPLAGGVVDRVGIRPALLAGVVGFGAALVGVAVAQAPWQIFAAIVGLGAPAHTVIQISCSVAASRVGEPTRRGGAFGVLGAGIGLGLALLPPVSVWVASEMGWRTVILGLSVVSTLLGVFAANFVREHQHGGHGHPATPASPVTASVDLIRSRAFVWLFVGGIGIGLLDEAVYQHLVPHLQANGLPAADAATALGIASMGYLAGQIVGGLASDRFGRYPIGVMAALAAAAAVFLLGTGRSMNYIALALLAITYGVGLGATIVVRNTTVADTFHGPFLGRVMGVYQWAYALGGAGMAWLGSEAYGRFGSYSLAFVTAAIAAFVWITCLGAAVPRASREH